MVRLIADDKGRKRITIFKRGETFYARFRLINKSVAGNRLYITETLRSGDEKKAIERALDRMHVIGVSERKGLALKSKTVSAHIDAFVTEYETKLREGAVGHSAHVLRGYKKTLTRYWRDFIGKKLLKDVSIDDLKNYERWRQSYWKRWSDTQAKKANKNRRIKLNSLGEPKLPSNARHRVAYRTLVWELNAFKAFIRQEKAAGNYSGNADSFVVRKGAIVRRSGFTSAEYNRITSAMRRREWLSVGKHGNDPKLIRHRKMLRAYVIFMSNTGLRPGEARNLRWKDIAHSTNDAGEKIATVSVAQSYSKVDKRRVVISMPKAAEVLTDLFEDRRSSNNFAGDEDYVWCDSDGKCIGDFREGFNNLMKKAETEYDADRIKHTVYSLRHFYITERLKTGVPVYEIASNCGTSVQMIEAYYSDARPADFVSNLSKTRFPKKLL